MSACLICGVEVNRDGNGQMVSYCGLACRRASEYERKRLQARLLALESGLGRMRRGGGNQFQLDDMQAEIDQAGARLRELLSAP